MVLYMVFRGAWRLEYGDMPLHSNGLRTARNQQKQRILIILTRWGRKT